jgi:streptogramin lyase
MKENRGTAIVSTFVGDVSDQIDRPSGIAIDTDGTVYVAELINHRVRKITQVDGVVIITTLAGTGTQGFLDGSSTVAQFCYPRGIVVDASRNVYVADLGNHRIRKITPTGDVLTFAGSGVAGFSDGSATQAQFHNPTGLAVDASGNVYVADKINHRIRKITQEGIVSTLAGSGTQGFADGAAASAQFSTPIGVIIDTSGTIYVGDFSNHRIRKITLEGIVSTLAGSGTRGFADGTAASAQFNYPMEITVDTEGYVYVADSYNHRIRKITPSGDTSTVAGSCQGFTNGTTASSRFSRPIAIALDKDRNIYVIDDYNNKIRKISRDVAATVIQATFRGWRARMKYRYTPYTCLGRHIILRAGEFGLMNHINDYSTT